MSNVAHASLTGDNLHEPKGIGTALIGQVYVADGASSGAWTSTSLTAFTGMVADFPTPVAPTGWLECNGADISTTTYAAIYAVMTIQQSGARISGNATVASLSSTTNIKPGYYAFATGIASGTTVLSVDSSTQVTLSNNASTTTTGTVVFSPYLLNTGTIRLPDLYTDGRFRRSRTATSYVGSVQADQNKAHTHTATTDAGGAHAHTVTDPSHQHSLLATTAAGSSNPGSGNSNAGAAIIATSFALTGISVDATTNHTHTLTTASTGSTEARPLGLVFMTCIKT